MAGQEAPLAVLDMSSSSWEQFPSASNTFIRQLSAHAEDGTIPGLHRRAQWSAKRALGTSKQHWRIVLQRDDIKDKVFSIELMKANHNHPMLASYYCKANDFQGSSWPERDNIWQQSDVRGIDVIDLAINSFKNLFKDRMYNFFTRNCQNYVNTVLTDLGMYRHQTSVEKANTVAVNSVLPAIVGILLGAVAASAYFLGRGLDEPRERESDSDTD